MACVEDDQLNIRPLVFGTFLNVAGDGIRTENGRLLVELPGFVFVDGGGGVDVHGKTKIKDTLFGETALLVDGLCDSLKIGFLKIFVGSLFFVEKNLFVFKKFTCGAGPTHSTRPTRTRSRRPTAYQIPSTRN